MAILLLSSDPVLRHLAEPIEFPRNLTSLLKDMTQVMKQAGGIGLAAPQIGKALRVAIVAVPKRLRVELINPEIIVKRGFPIPVVEGCLSLPGREYKVLRYMDILVKYQDRRGVYHAETFRGLEAQAVQHEIDHLNGQLLDEQKQA